MKISYLMSVLIMIACRQNTIYTEKVHLLECTNPKTSGILIKNNDNTDLYFNLVVNNNDFSSIKAICKQIKLLNKQKSEPLEKTAWYFIDSISSGGVKVADDFPTINSINYINSVGQGLCFLENNLLAEVWSELGFESRVWHIGGHVVAEVKTDNIWKIYDASLGAYYLKEDSTLAGVDFLENNKSVNLYQKKEWIGAYNYANSSFIKALYLSKENNTFKTVESTKVNFKYYLPKNSELFLSSYFFTKKNLPIKLTKFNYSYLKINKSFSGHIPLEFLTTKTEGDIKFYKNKTEIFLDNTIDSIKNIFFLSSIDSVEIKDSAILYLNNNPNIFLLNTQNDITIIANKPNQLEVSIKKTPIKVNENRKKLKNRIQELEIDLKEINSTNDSIKTIITKSIQDKNYFLTKTLLDTIINNENDNLISFNEFLTKDKNQELREISKETNIYIYLYLLYNNNLLEN